MKKSRVAAYCRVSKGGLEPEHSLQAQADYYKEMIESNPQYRLVGIYAEIASGLQIKKRKQFQKLLRDCRNRKIDLIYTKSISRFARNIVDFLSVIRKMRQWGVDVIFENEHLNNLVNPLLHYFENLEHRELFLVLRVDIPCWLLTCGQPCFGPDRAPLQQIFAGCGRAAPSGNNKKRNQQTKYFDFNCILS